MNESVLKYSIEITLETHDEKIRRYNGKFSCTNQKVIDTLNFALKYNCKKIDHVLSLPDDEQAFELARIQEEIKELNKYSICGKNELKWEVQKNYANFFSLALVGIEQLYEDYVNKIRHFLSPKRRQQFQLDTEYQKIK